MQESPQNPKANLLPKLCFPRSVFWALVPRGIVNVWQKTGKEFLSSTSSYLWIKRRINLSEWDSTKKKEKKSIWVPINRRHIHICGIRIMEIAQIIAPEIVMVYGIVRSREEFMQPLGLLQLFDKGYCTLELGGPWLVVYKLCGWLRSQRRFKFTMHYWIMRAWWP